MVTITGKLPVVTQTPQAPRACQINISNHTSMTIDSRTMDKTKPLQANSNPNTTTNPTRIQALGIIKLTQVSGKIKPNSIKTSKPTSK